jgi:hypothetical protein
LRLFAGQLTLRAAAVAARGAAEAAAAFAGLARRRTIGNRHRLAVDLEVGRRDAAAAIHQRELERLAVGEAGEAGLLDCRDVHEHVFAAVIANNEAEALLAVEELNDALALADDLGRHSAAARAAEAAATTAAEAAATTEIVAAEAVALVSAASAALAAAPSVKTHAV